MLYEVVYSRAALRGIGKIPRSVAENIRNKINLLAADPGGRNNNVKKLQGGGGYRLRVGDYRVIYTIDNRILIIHVIRIGLRGDIYK